MQTAEEMVRAGLLVQHDGRYKITREGLRVLEQESHASETEVHPEVG
jgi:hypothetical protein